MSKKIIKCLKNSIAEKGNYCYSLPVETTKAVIKELNRLNNIIDELEKYCNEEIIDYDKAIDSKILSEIDRDRYEAEKVCFLDMLDKLKALKENK